MRELLFADDSALFAHSAEEMQKIVDVDRLPKQVLYSQLFSGHRKRGRPRLRFKNTIKRKLKPRDTKTDSWTSLSHKRDKWRAIVK